MPVPTGYTTLAQALAEVTLDVFQQVQTRLNLDVQAFSDVLTSISLSGLGIGYLVINGDGTVGLRTFTATGGLQVTNGNGVAAHTEYSLDAPTTAAIAGKLDKAGGAMTGALALAADPAAALQAATKQYVDNTVNALLDAANAEQYKGLLDCSGNPNYPAANIGWTYRVSVAGLIGGGAGVAVEIGDRVQCITDGSAAGTQAAVGANWWITQANVAFTSNGVSLVTAANYAAMKVLLALDNVTNTSDANKPVSTAQQTALNLKANLISPAFTTPDLGVATASRINKVNIVQPATAAALNIGDNQTLTVNASMVLATAVANPTITFQGTDTYVGRATTDSMSNKTLVGNTGFQNISPKASIDNNLNTVTSPALVVATSLQRNQAADGAVGGTEWVSYGASPQNVLAGCLAGGTAAVPTGAPATKNMFVLRGYGWDTVGWALGALITIRSGDAAAWSATNHGAQIDFYTTPNATTALSLVGGWGPKGGLYASNIAEDNPAFTLKLKPQTFATLPVASAALEGTQASVTDSTTAVWRATITGGGANHVLAYCNGTNWTVSG